MWVVGIYDTFLKRGVIEYVEYRDADTLTELVRKYVAPLYGSVAGLYPTS